MQASTKVLSYSGRIKIFGKSLEWNTDKSFPKVFLMIKRLYMVIMFFFLEMKLVEHSGQCVEFRPKENYEHCHKY